MTPWVSGPVIDCPFGLCAARVELVIEQAIPGDDEQTVKRIPIHEIAGLDGYRGPCPTSLMGYPLEGAAEELLHDEELRIARIIAGNPPAPDSTRTPAAEHSKTPHPNADGGRWFGTGSNAGGRPLRNDGPAAEGYPRLPFSAQGPGIDTPTSPQTPADAGPSNGANVSDNMRDQLRALTALAIEGFGHGQELCAIFTNTLDEITGSVSQMSESHDATHQLAVAAVGGMTDNLPGSAANMIGSSNAAGSTISGDEGLVQALQLAQTRIEAIYGSYHAAAEAGTEYLGTI